MSKLSASPTSADAPDESYLPDVLASVVVFLVALPLCIGLALASGVPVERGLITGIVGGLIVGAVSGSPLLVSGPAASLLVLVWGLVTTHGLAMLGPVVVGAGLVQIAAGLLGLGRWFRAAAPAVIQGMMTGIGVLIVASQLHVMLDAKPASSLFENLSSFPAVLWQALRTGHPALGVGLVTLAVLAAWKSLRPERLALVPPQLVAVVAVVAGCQALAADVLYLDVQGSLFAGLDFTTPADMSAVVSGGLIGQCLVFAFVASAATLLSATAVDQMQSRVQTDYDRELLAQGIGNTVAGWLGGLPMTGVIVRSSANVEAGANSRLSTILHGAWLLGFIVLAPGLLALIPKATLGAILVAIGVGLASPAKMMALQERDRTELLVGLVTFGGVVGLDLFSGILLGLGASVLRLVYAFTRFDVSVEPGKDGHHDLSLSGFATFLQVPRLAAALDAIPPGSQLTVHLDALAYADHACLEQLAATERRLRAGGGKLSVQWDELLRRYKEGPRTGEDAAGAAEVGSLRRVVQAFRHVAGRSGQASQPVLASLQISPDRVQLDLPGGELSTSLHATMTPLLAGLPLDAEAVGPELERKAARRALHLGEGVLLVHESLPELTEARLGLARLDEPVRLANGSGDLLFVLLDQAEDPDAHLLALGCLAHICADPARLQALREAKNAEEIVALIEAGIAEAEASRSALALPAGSLLSVIKLAESSSHVEAFTESLRRTFGTVRAVPSSDESLHRLMAAAAGIKSEGDLVLVDVLPAQLEVLYGLAEEYGRSSGIPTPEVHLMQPLDKQALPRRKAV